MDWILPPVHFNSQTMQQKVDGGNQLSFQTIYPKFRIYSDYYATKKRMEEAR